MHIYILIKKNKITIEKEREDKKISKLVQQINKSKISHNHGHK